MAQRHVYSQKATHRPLTTAHLAQTMSLLEMNNNELAEKIQQELSNNPALELKEDYRCPVCGKKLVNQFCSVCSSPPTLDLTDPIVFVSSRNSYSGSTNYNRGDEIDRFEDFSVDTEDLPFFVLNQIRTDLKPDERAIAAAILHGLDDNGLFPTPLVELAVLHHVPLSKIEHVRSLIQHSDPVGVASQSPQEALIIQAETLREEGIAIPPLTKRALEEGFNELSRQDHRGLSKLLGISLKDTEKIISFISDNLNPFPAHAYWGDHRNQTNDDPDAQLIVQVLWPIYGNLHVNQFFKKVLAESKNGDGKKLAEEHQKASLLIKCIAQRNHTLVQLMQKLAHEQRDFILNGDRYLKPMTRASVAEDLGVHESTISRAVSSKSVQLPSSKIIPISQFFDRSLHIRARIKDIIAAEVKPLSDTKIASKLKEDGYNIARRTVAKYRSMERILPAHLRKKEK
jgi:RNA polymerase sigma-54 factor